MKINTDADNIGLYIHIPFCKYICTYCDFCKKKIEKYDTDEYVNVLIEELKSYKHLFHKVNSIYIGGGTPSSLSKENLERLFQYIDENINLQNVLEYTIEANPDDIKDIFNAKFLYDNKINRVSLGVQTLNDDVLKRVNREHTKHDVIRAINLLSEYIKNVNIDLMFNLPKQNMEDIQNTFSFLKKYNDKISHLSYYDLILEEDTVLWNEEFENFSEDEEDNVYKLIQKEVQALGYFQYEISNYAKKGYESIHNLKYWQREQYIGAGLGASGFLGTIRYTNTKSYTDYINGIKAKRMEYLEEEELDYNDEIQEKIMLGLRLVEGIDINLLNQNVVKENLEYLNIENNKVSIKQNYLFLSNEIILSFLE